jgi:hypothetical protein
MSSLAHRVAVLIIPVAACLAVSGAAAQQKPSPSRGVTVKERLPDPAPPVVAPAPPAPSDPALLQRGADEARPSQGPAPGRPELSASPVTPPPPPRPDVAIGPGNVEVPLANAAGLKLQLGGETGEYRVGERLVVRVSSERPGYLVLLDVSAEGRITQIYPNSLSLLVEGRDVTEANRVKPGTPVTIPDPRNEVANFDFIASPPLGTGMLVALLSDKPVQVVDLPDLPKTGPRPLEFVQQATRSLKITPATGGPLLDPRWSFAAREYTIRP